MIPEKLDFLSRFDIFYQVIVKAAKEGKLDEKDFYIIIGAKCKTMNRERRERKVLLNKEPGKKGKALPN